MSVAEIEKAVKSLVQEEGEPDASQMDLGGPREPDAYDADELFYAWKDAVDKYPSSQAEEFTKLVKALGYDDLDSFLGDNPGVMEKMTEWVIQWVHKNREWKEKLIAAIEAEGGTLPEPIG